MHGVVPDKRLTSEATEVLPRMAKDEQTRAFLASIVESSDDSIVGTDLEGTILSWNGGAERLWGYSAAEAIGKHITILFPPDRQQDHLLSLGKVRREERVERFESQRVRKDGTQVDVSVILSPIKDSLGRLQGVSAIYRDITKRNEAEAALLVAKQFAESSSRAKSEFLANMNHEIRTPLNGIIGLTELVLDSELNEEQCEYLSIVKTSAESLLKILSDLLDFSKIQAGKFVLQPKQFWLKDLINTTVSGWASVAGEKNLQVACEIRSEVPKVLLGDPICLRQILDNLIGNAIKFTPAGKVVITVETSPESPGALHFGVRNTGIGIAPDKQEVIFEPMSQADGSASRKFGGAGLGLAISAQLVEMMGGQIWLQSDGRTGSTFHFTVRMEAVDAPAVDGTPAKSPTDIQPTAAISTQPGPDERRRELRKPTNDAASAQVISPLTLEHLDVQVLDISRNGLKIRAPKFLNSGVILQMRLRDTLILGEVRYCVQTDDGFWAGLHIQDCVERRHTKRSPVDIPVTIGELQSGQPARIVDKSLEGMLIVAQHRVPEGTLLCIIAEEKPILVEVVHCKRDGDRFKIGVRINQVLNL